MHVPHVATLAQAAAHLTTLLPFLPFGFSTIVVCVVYFWLCNHAAGSSSKVLHSTISFAADLFCAQLFVEHMSEHLRFMQVFFEATYSIFDVLVWVCATLFMAS